MAVASGALLLANGNANASSDSAVRFCTNCGTKLEAHHKFCANCGTPVAV